MFAGQGAHDDFRGPQQPLGKREGSRHARGENWHDPGTLAMAAAILAAGSLAGCGHSGGGGGTPAGGQTTVSTPLPAGTPAGGQTAASGQLPAGTSTISIKAYWVLDANAGNAYSGVRFTGTAGGLALTGTALIPASDIGGTAECGIYPGTSVTGTLGGVGFSLTPQCSRSGPLTYSGTWGQAAIAGTAAQTESATTRVSAVTITATIGTQRVSATITATPSPKGIFQTTDPNMISGTMTVS